MTAHGLAADRYPPGEGTVALGTRERFGRDRCPPGEGEVSPGTRQEVGRDRCPPGAGPVASVTRQRLGGDRSSCGAERAASVTGQEFAADDSSPGAVRVAPESCPDCARRAVILRVVEGLQAKPPTRAQRAAAGPIIRGILGCGCQTEASSPRQNLALATPSRGNATALPHPAEVPRRAVDAVPPSPTEVLFARAGLQP